MSWQKKIKAARERLGIGKSELALMIGVSPSAITQWERESDATKNIDGANLVAVAKALQVTAEWIMGNDDELPPLSAVERQEATERRALNDELRDLLRAASEEVKLLTVHRLADTTNRRVLDDAVTYVINDLDIGTLLNKRKDGASRP